jgi:hypothetical protein
MRNSGVETRTYRVDWEATIEGEAYIEASSVTEAVRYFNEEPGIYTNPLVCHKVASKPNAQHKHGYKIKVVEEEYDENGNRIKRKEEE